MPSDCDEIVTRMGKLFVDMIDCQRIAQKYRIRWRCANKVKTREVQVKYEEAI